MAKLIVHHRIVRDDVALGVVFVEGIVSSPAPAELASALDARIAGRRADAAAATNAIDEARRTACRDILRNGAYKPTGRSKPANEYLLRAALENTFPRINGPVDANNLVSLGANVPISLWDLDLAETNEFEFRLGAPGERYVFNSAGQELELQDLICGAGLKSGKSQPLVTPVKDGLATKLTPTSTRLAAAIYFPVQAGGAEAVVAIASELLYWLKRCGPSVQGGTGICMPNGTVEL